MARVLILVALLIPGAIANGQDLVYVRTPNNSLARVPKSQIAGQKVEEWQIRLYRRGDATGGSNHWGLITGPSSAHVEAQLKEDQNFEKVYERWCQCGQDVLTYFNSMGPIAVIGTGTPSDSKTKFLAYYNKLSKIWSEYKELKEAWETAEKIVTGKGIKPATPFDHVGEVFKEYSENLTKVQKQVDKLQKDLEVNVVTNVLEKQIINEINSLNESIGLATKSSQDFQSLVGDANDYSWGNSKTDTFVQSLGVVNGDLVVEKKYASGTERYEVRLQDLDKTSSKIFNFSDGTKTQWYVRFFSKNASYAVNEHHLDGSSGNATFITFTFEDQQKATYAQKMLIGLLD
jgi:hypothetical protein